MLARAAEFDKEQLTGLIKEQIAMAKRVSVADHFKK
jgi:hypothetical protein